MMVNLPELQYGTRRLRNKVVAPSFRGVGEGEETHGLVSLVDVRAHVFEFFARGLKLCVEDSKARLIEHLLFLVFATIPLTFHNRRFLGAKLVDLKLINLDFVFKFMAREHPRILRASICELLNSLQQCM